MRASTFCLIISLLSFSEKYGKLIIQSYYAAVSYVDNMIGKLIHQLHVSRIRENTIVILTSDHGTFFFSVDEIKYACSYIKLTSNAQVGHLESTLFGLNIVTSMLLYTYL